MKSIGKNGRALLYVLLLLSLTVQSFIPAGFMPAQEKNGLVEIVLCTGSGASKALVDAAGSPFPDESRHQGRQHGDSHASACPYAPVLAHAAPVHAPGAMPVLLPGGDVPLLVAVLVPSGPSVKPWFSQGPPAVLAQA